MIVLIEDDDIDGQNYGRNLIEMPDGDDTAATAAADDDNVDADGDDNNDTGDDDNDDADHDDGDDDDSDSHSNQYRGDV